MQIFPINWENIFKILLFLIHIYSKILFFHEFTSLHCINWQNFALDWKCPVIQNVTQSSKHKDKNFIFQPQSLTMTIHRAAGGARETENSWFNNICRCRPSVRTSDKSGWAKEKLYLIHYIHLLIVDCRIFFYSPNYYYFKLIFFNHTKMSQLNFCNNWRNSEIKLCPCHSPAPTIFDPSTLNLIPPSGVHELIFETDLIYMELERQILCSLHICTCGIHTTLSLATN